MSRSVAALSPKKLCPDAQVRRSIVSLAHRLDGLDKPTVWHEFSPLAVQHDAVNLGQGFPDWEPPQFVLESMQLSITNKNNQYARSAAHLPLAQVLAEDYFCKWKIRMDPATQIATAVGCTNALYCALQGLINPGDEVILLEPAFDIYASQVRMAGGEPVYVPLRPNLSNTGGGASHVFELDADELRAAISPQTKALLLNTPHNPTGKMFSRAELEMIASVVKEHSSMIVISDEVYEHIVFDVEHEPHVSMATIPNMFDRTLTLSSAGKTFSCTGWKVGWAVGPQPLVRAVMAAQQWVNFSAPTPNQDAIARALVLAREPYQGFATYYDYLANEYKRKRGLLVAALEAANMTAVLPPGGFFVLADTSRIQFPEQYMDEVTEASPVPMTRDWAMSRWLTKEVGVTAIPPSAFYSQANMHLAGNFLRFAFCKGDDTLTEAHQRFKKYFK